VPGYHSSVQVISQRAFRLFLHTKLTRRAATAPNHWTISLCVRVAAHSASSTLLKPTFALALGIEFDIFCSMPEQVLKPAVDQLALQNLLAAHGGCIHESQVVTLLGLRNASTIAEWRKHRQIVSVQTEGGHRVYPIWQFARKHRRVMLGIRDCLAELIYEHEWEPVVFFLTKKKCLDGHSPLDRLRAGKIEAAILAARQYGQFTDG
jgi:hypothetical protein